MEKITELKAYIIKVNKEYDNGFKKSFYNCCLDFGTNGEVYFYRPNYYERYRVGIDNVVSIDVITKVDYPDYIMNLSWLGLGPLVKEKYNIKEV